MSADNRIAEIEARLQAATPGPWVDDFHPGYPRRHYIANKFDVICETGAHERTPKNNMENSEFLANAPADIRYLLDENKRLQALQNAVTCCYCGWKTWQDEETQARIDAHRLNCDGYRGEVKRLCEALEKIVADLDGQGLDAKYIAREALEGK